MKRKTCFEKHVSKIAPSRTNENHESREKDYIVAHRMKNERKVSIYHYRIEWGNSKQENHTMKELQYLVSSHSPNDSPLKLLGLLGASTET